MIAREASYPPDISTASTPALTTHNDTPPPSNKKRKHAAISGSNNRSNAASPAPMDPAYAGAQAAGASVLPTTDSGIVDTRPRLTVSRSPVFVPVSEGSIYHTTEQVAVNRLGFRYIPAGLAESGSKLLYRTIESYPPGYVRVSWEDRSPFVKVTTDGLGLCGEKGYRSARLNVPVREGKWYVEIKVELGGDDRPPESTLKEGAHVRLGWGRREAGLNCPVGLDGYSYGYRDKDGRKITLSRARPYGEKYGSGDVIGMYISLPPKRKPKANDPHDPAHLKRERIAIDFKGQAYFESVEYPQSKEMVAFMESSTNKAKDTASLPSSAKKSATVKNVPERGRGNKALAEPAPLQPLPTLRGSHIAFFVNGRCQGIAFQDLFDYLQLRTIPSARNQRSKRRLREGYVEHTENPFDDGTLGYYPFISLFNGARVHINAGPDFEFPPPNDIEGVLANDPDSADTKHRSWRPLCERYEEFMQEQRELDAKDEAEAVKRLAAEAQRQQQQHENTSAKPPKKGGSEHPSRPSRPPAHHSKLSKVHHGQVKVASGSAAPSPKPAPSPAPAEPTTPLPVQDSPSKLEVYPPLQADVPMAADAPPTPLPPTALAPSPTPASTSIPQAQTTEPHELSEQEKKLEARRQRKRELERARRAKKREERLALKKQQEEAEAQARAQSEVQAQAELFLQQIQPEQYGEGETGRRKEEGRGTEAQQLQRLVQSAGVGVNVDPSILAAAVEAVAARLSNAKKMGLSVNMDVDLGVAGSGASTLPIVPTSHAEQHSDHPPDHQDTDQDIGF